MALKYYNMYSIYFIILIHIIINYLALFTYMYSCYIWDYLYVNMSRYLIYYACNLYCSAYSTKSFDIYIYNIKTSFSFPLTETGSTEIHHAQECTDLQKWEITHPALQTELNNRENTRWSMEWTSGGIFLNMCIILETVHYLECFLTKSFRNCVWKGSYYIGPIKNS